MGGVVDFFKRKFEFTSVERTPKFSDIDRRHNLDIELAASGFSKQIEQEIEAFEKEFRPIREGEDGPEDSESDEDEDESEESKKGPEKSEEKKKEKEPQTTSRFENWLQEAADTTENVPEESPEVIDAELNEEQRAQAEAIIARNSANQAQAQRNNNVEEEENDQVGDLPEIERDAFQIADAMSKMSSLSTTSCSPAEIKMRVKKQMSLEKKRERARLLKKGETSKYT